jgi:hypothetical protein
MGLQGLDMRAIGTQAVFSDDKLEVRVILAQLAKEAFGGIAFAIIFVRAILLDDRFRHQRNDFPHVWMDQRSAQHLMRIGDTPVAVHLLLDMTHNESSWRKNTRAASITRRPLSAPDMKGFPL